MSYDPMPFLFFMRTCIRNQAEACGGQGRGSGRVSWRKTSGNEKACTSQPKQMQRQGLDCQSQCRVELGGNRSLKAQVQARAQVRDCL